MSSSGFILKSLIKDIDNLAEAERLFDSHVDTGSERYFEARLIRAQRRYNKSLKEARIFTKDILN